MAERYPVYATADVTVPTARRAQGSDRRRGDRGAAAFGTSGDAARREQWHERQAGTTVKVGLGRARLRHPDRPRPARRGPAREIARAAARRTRCRRHRRAMSPAAHLRGLRRRLGRRRHRSAPPIVAAGRREDQELRARWRRWSTSVLAARLERGDVVIALGGGVIGDLAGFAAGIVRRGMNFRADADLAPGAGRFLGRRQDRHQQPRTARTWSASSTSRGWCWPTPTRSTRCRRANSAPAMPRSPNTG